MKKESKFEKVLSSAAHMLVSAQVGCIRWTDPTDTMHNFYSGKRQAAQFIIKRFAEIDPKMTGRAIGEWVSYLRKDFPTSQKKEAVA